MVFPWFCKRLPEDTDRSWLQIFPRNTLRMMISVMRKRIRVEVSWFFMAEIAIPKIKGKFPHLQRKWESITPHSDPINQHFFFEVKTAGTLRSKFHSDLSATGCSVGWYRRPAGGSWGKLLPDRWWWSCFFFWREILRIFLPLKSFIPGWSYRLLVVGWEWLRPSLWSKYGAVGSQQHRAPPYNGLSPLHVRDTVSQLTSLSNVYVYIYLHIYICIYYYKLL